MKKRSYLLMLVALFGFSLSAQNEGKVTIVETIDKYKVETNKFWNNWFIAAGGGFQMYLGDHNKQMDFIDRVSPAFNISLGKWFTPGVGMRFSYAGRKVKGATQNGSYSTGERYWEEPHWLDKQEFDYNHYYADVMFNLTNLIAGYNPKHWFNVSPYIGAGLLTNVSGGERRREIGGNIGFLFGLNVNKYFDINLDVRGTMIGDAFDGEVGGSKFDGIISTTLGLAYKFPKRGWDKRVIITKTIDRSEEITVLNNEINELRATNEAIQNTLSQQVVSEQIENTVVAPQLIIFEIGKSKLSKDSRVNIGFMSKLMKENPGNKFLVTGYADAATGNAETNKRLSNERAKAVYDCLVNEFGVSPAVLEYKGLGEVDNMFYDDPELSRATITQIKR